MSKSTINRRRQPNESTRAAAKRLITEEPTSAAGLTAKKWLANKGAKPARKTPPQKRSAEVAMTTPVSKPKKR